MPCALGVFMRSLPWLLLMFPLTVSAFELRTDSQGDLVKWHGEVAFVVDFALAEVLREPNALQAVKSAIAELDEDQRMLVALRDIEGLSYEEIVEITELPEGTVKSRLHRAREKLVGILERLENQTGHRGE